jgi:hypothetical protein
VRRGELYTYVRPATPTNRRTVLVLAGNDVIRPTRPWVLGIEIRSDDPEDLLAVPLGDGRFAYAGDLGRLYRAWFGRRAGRVDPLTLTRIDTVLRVALDL